MLIVHKPYNSYLEYRGILFSFFPIYRESLSILSFPYHCLSCKTEVLNCRATLFLAFNIRFVVKLRLSLLCVHPYLSRDWIPPFSQNRNIDISRYRYIGISRYRIFLDIVTSINSWYRNIDNYFSISQLYRY